MSEKTETATVQESDQLINPQNRMSVSDDGDLILNPSIEDRRYLFMPTVVEVLGAYCIQSDLEIPTTILENLTDNAKKFCEEEWNGKKLRNRRVENIQKKGMLTKGNTNTLGQFTRHALEDREFGDKDEAERGYFKEMCERVANDDGLQKSLEAKLPEKLKELLGNSGFKSYLLESYR